MIKEMRKWLNQAVFYGKLIVKDFYDMKKIWLFFRIYPYTMVSYERLSNVYELAQAVEKNKLPGAFAECGVWKGGCVAIMGYVAKQAKNGRKTWLFDSFEGLPEPTKEDGEVAKSYSGNRNSGKLQSVEKCVGPLEDVKKIFFEVLKIQPQHVVIKQGWFQNTLPSARNEIGPIAILRLDGDWYESTKVCLENLYENMVPGGYVIIDDYGHWEGAKKAVQEFFAEKNIKPELVKIDYTGVYFKKT